MDLPHANSVGTNPRSHRQEIRTRILLLQLPRPAGLSQGFVLTERRQQVHRGVTKVRLCPTGTLPATTAAAAAAPAAAVAVVAGCAVRLLRATVKLRPRSNRQRRRRTTTTLDRRLLAVRWTTWRSTGTQLVNHRGWSRRDRFSFPRRKATEGRIRRCGGNLRRFERSLRAASPV